MVSKILAAVFAVAVLTVGGYTYWQYSGGHCCGTQPAAAPSTCTETPSCCQEPSRTSCFGLPPGESCCEDVDFNAKPSPEVLTIQPRVVQ